MATIAEETPEQQQQTLQDLRNSDVVVKYLDASVIVKETVRIIVNISKMYFYLHILTNAPQTHTM